MLRVKIRPKSQDKIDFNYTKLTHTHILIYFDIKKAYDNVDIDLLNYFIANDPDIDLEIKRLWINEYFDIKNYLIAIGPNVLYRQYGLAQGSLLSPMLFNYYISKIITQPNIERYTYDANFKLFIYADNILILLTKEYDNNEINNIIDSFKLTMNEFHLTFDEPIILKFDKIGVPTCNIKYIKNIKNTVKILGIEFNVDTNNGLNLNYNSMLFNLLPIKCRTFYKAIKYIKKYYLGKFLFYYNFLLIFQKDIAEEYKEWFIDKVESWIKTTSIIIKLNKDIIKRILFPKDFNLDKYEYGEYYSNHVSNFNTPFNDIILERYRIICIKLLHEGLIANADDIINYIKHNKSIEFHELKSLSITIFKFLDDIYFNIKTNRNLFESSFIDTKII